MKATNLAKSDGLPAIEWAEVEKQLADLLTHDDPRTPDRSTSWLTTLNSDGSPHVTSVKDAKVIGEIAALWAKHGWPAEPDDSDTGITAPFNAPTLGPPPWFVYELKPRTATAVGTAEESPGSMRWRF